MLFLHLFFKLLNVKLSLVFLHFIPTIFDRTLVKCGNPTLFQCLRQQEKHQKRRLFPFPLYGISITSNKSDSVLSGCRNPRRVENTTSIFDDFPGLLMKHCLECLIYLFKQRKTMRYLNLFHGYFFVLLDELLINLRNIYPC